MNVQGASKLLDIFWSELFSLLPPDVGFFPWSPLQIFSSLNLLQLSDFLGIMKLENKWSCPAVACYLVLVKKLKQKEIAAIFGDRSNTVSNAVIKAEGGHFE